MNLNGLGVLEIIVHDNQYFFQVPPCALFQISEAIRDGAEGFFRTQYGTISKMAFLLAFVILCIYLFRSTTPQQEASGIGR